MESAVAIASEPDCERGEYRTDVVLTQAPVTRAEEGITGPLIIAQAFRDSPCNGALPRLR